MFVGLGVLDRFFQYTDLARAKSEAPMNKFIFEIKQ